MFAIVVTAETSHCDTSPLKYAALENMARVLVTSRISHVDSLSLMPSPSPSEMPEKSEIPFPSSVLSNMRPESFQWETSGAKRMNCSSGG